MPARKLILVRHSLPEVRPDIPASDWELSEEGRARCLPLAERLMAYRIQALACSRELKAYQTASILGDRLSLPVEPFDNLHEHQRPAGPWLGREVFEAQVQKFFTQPDDLVFGMETAAQAARRFTTAMKDVLARHPQETVAVIAHGTVMTLFAGWSSRTDPDAGDSGHLDPFHLWKQLDLPAYFVFSLPGLHLDEVVDRVV